MSRLSELLRQARNLDTQLGVDLEAEFSALMKRRTFGLVFEPHEPEAVELPGRVVRRGDTVRILAARGEKRSTDQRLWRVARVDRTDEGRFGHLIELGASDPDDYKVNTTDLVVVAEFNERIYPGLVKTGNVSSGDLSQPSHTVINGENFHALELLSYTHRHSIDAIYIDPPYNTGAKDWKYNNDYVEGDDDYRHSKWLAFMERRLRLARELLNPDGSVLIMSIDEREGHRAALLLEQTFPEARVQMVSSVINPKGVPKARDFSRADEWIFFVMFGDASPARWVTDMMSETDPSSKPVRYVNLKREGSNWRRSDRPGLFYPIFVRPNDGQIVEFGDPIALNVDRDSVPGKPGLLTVWPIKPDGSEARWQQKPQSARALHKSGYLRSRLSNDRKSVIIEYLSSGQVKSLKEGILRASGRDSNGALVLEPASGATQIPKTVWRQVSHSSTEHGSKVLASILPERKFPFPKSLYAVEDALRFFIRDKPDATVLDFFSGSGTTAHAVMRLNRQYGGHRQCISVTNNEVSAKEQKTLRAQGLRPGDPEWEKWGICDYITKPRITAAITGQTPDGKAINGTYKFTDEFPMSEGFAENAAFFTLTYEDPITVRHDRAFARIAPLLWMRAGSRGRMIDDLGPSGWDVAESYGVLKNMDQMAAFAGHVDGMASVETVFLITDSDAAFQMTCKELPGHVTPVRLYESYLHNFAINRRA